MQLYMPSTPSISLGPCEMHRDIYGDAKYVPAQMTSAQPQFALTCDKYVTMGTYCLYICRDLAFHLFRSSFCTMNSHQIPDHWAISYTDTLATYMVARFKETMQPDTETQQKAIPHSRIPMETLCEVDRMVGILARAYRNKGMQILV